MALLIEHFRNCTAGPIILSLSHKGSGKTSRITTLIKHLLNNDLNDRYLLFLPSYQFEAKGSYARLEVFKNKVFIALEVTLEKTLQAFLKRPSHKFRPRGHPKDPAVAQLGWPPGCIQHPLAPEGRD